MQKANSFIQTILLVIFTFHAVISIAQPLSPPIPFEDYYRGAPDIVMATAKVKTKRTYYKLKEGNTVNILYNIFEYNKKGYLINQKWYNLDSKKEMYSVHYEYDSDNYFTSCIEKITKKFDNFDLYSRKTTNQGYFINATDSNPMGEIIPFNKDSNLIIKTIYKKDSLNGYIAKKYFYDGSFYKEKKCPFWQYSPQFHENIYINKGKTIDFVCSDLYYKTDTFYQSADSLNISIKAKKNNLDYFNILTIKHNNEFIITEINIISEKIKLFFSYQNSAFDDGTIKSEISSITYLSSKIAPDRFLLIHKFQDLDSVRIALKDRIELKEIYSLKKLKDLHGCVYYTNFENGYLKNETQYSIGYDNIQKLQDIHYTTHNLISEKIQYSASFGDEQRSTLFDGSNLDKVIEINAYEYFD